MALPAGFTIIEDDAPAGLPAGFSLMDEEKKKKEYSFTDWFNNPFSGEAEGEFQMPTMDETAAGMTNPAGVGPFQGGGEAALAGFTEASARPLYGALDMLEEEGFLNTLPLELTEGTVLNKTRRKEALEFARNSPYPQPSALYEDMWANPIPQP